MFIHRDHCLRTWKNGPLLEGLGRRSVRLFDRYDDLGSIHQISGYVLLKWLLDPFLQLNDYLLLFLFRRTNLDKNGVFQSEHIKMKMPWTQKSGESHCMLRMSTYYYYFFFRAMLVAHESSQARRWIRAAAAGLCHSHSNAGSILHASAVYAAACHKDGFWILNPLSKARDWTSILMDTMPGF